MFSKFDMLKRLREHPLYKAALASVDVEQAKKIAAIAESFLGEAADGLTPMIQQASDPNARQALNEATPVLTVEPPSGSKEG